MTDKEDANGDEITGQNDSGYSIRRFPNSHPASIIANVFYRNSFLSALFPLSVWIYGLSERYLNKSEIHRKTWE